MAEPQTKDLIDRLLDYKVVTIDGKQFEVRNQDGLNALDLRWIIRKQSRIHELWEKDDPTTDEVEEFSRILRRYCRIVLNAPEELQDSLNDIHRKQVMDFFLQDSSVNPPQTRTNGQKNGKKRAGRNSSRA